MAKLIRRELETKEEIYKFTRSKFPQTHRRRRMI